jgi:hypothetical protein
VWRHLLLLLPPRSVKSGFGRPGDSLEIRLRDLSLKHGRPALDVGPIAVTAWLH